MNKAGLVEVIAKNTQLTKTVIEQTLDCCLENIKKTVSNNEDVTLVGFGTFTCGCRKARPGRNPQTGQVIEIPAATLPKFRAGKEFKDLLQ